MTRKTKTAPVKPEATETAYLEFDRWQDAPTDPESIDLYWKKKKTVNALLNLLFEADQKINVFKPCRIEARKQKNCHYKYSLLHKE